VTVFAGDPINASDINGIISKLPTTYTKPSSTSRNTTTTLADDPFLSGIPLLVGTYDIECLIFFTTASSTPKIKTQWAFTGTWASSTRACFGPGDTNTAVPSLATPTTVRGYTTDAQEAVYGAANSGAYSAVRELVRGVTVTVAGNLSLKWAQSVSNGSNTTVQQGSAFLVTKTA
jgi:hypothetical protein